jgi:hypothetical protein
LMQAMTCKGFWSTHCCSTTDQLIIANPAAVQQQQLSAYCNTSQLMRPALAALPAPPAASPVGGTTSRKAEDPTPFPLHACLLQQNRPPPIVQQQPFINVQGSPEPAGCAVPCRPVFAADARVRGPDRLPFLQNSSSKSNEHINKMDQLSRVLLAALLICFASAAPAAHQRKPVEFTPSIHITYLNDVATTSGEGGERAIGMPRLRWGLLQAGQRACLAILDDDNFRASRRSALIKWLIRRNHTGLLSRRHPLFPSPPPHPRTCRPHVALPGDAQESHSLQLTQGQLCEPGAGSPRATWSTWHAQPMHSHGPCGRTHGYAAAACALTLRALSQIITYQFKDQDEDYHPDFYCIRHDQGQACVKVGGCACRGWRGEGVKGAGQGRWLDEQQRRQRQQQPCPASSQAPVWMRRRCELPCACSSQHFWGTCHLLCAPPCGMRCPSCCWTAR